ncbi:MAG TPA: hypothetical protein VLA77_00605 [Candidatus Saccharimonadales bacterium]|nr:hypothetical protein [Candidatus Saccharimonadales bacterium]
MAENPKSTDADRIVGFLLQHHGRISGRMIGGKFEEPTVAIALAFGIPLAEINALVATMCRERRTWVKKEGDVIVEMGLKKLPRGAHNSPVTTTKIDKKPEDGEAEVRESADKPTELLSVERRAEEATKLLTYLQGDDVSIECEGGDMCYEHNTRGKHNFIPDHNSILSLAAEVLTGITRRQASSIASLLNAMGLRWTDNVGGGLRRHFVDTSITRVTTEMVKQAEKAKATETSVKAGAPDEPEVPVAEEQPATEVNSNPLTNLLQAAAVIRDLRIKVASLEGRLSKKTDDLSAARSANRTQASEIASLKREIERLTAEVAALAHLKPLADAAAALGKEIGLATQLKPGASKRS